MLVFHIWVYLNIKVGYFVYRHFFLQLIDTLNRYFSGIYCVQSTVLKFYDQLAVIVNFSATPFSCCEFLKKLTFLPIVAQSEVYSLRAFSVSRKSLVKSSLSRYSITTAKNSLRSICLPVSRNIDVACAQFPAETAYAQHLCLYP